MKRPTGQPRAHVIATCRDCGKRCYLTRRDARRAARAIHPDVPLRAYQCGQWWHYGNTPQWIRRGDAA